MTTPPTTPRNDNPRNDNPFIRRLSACRYCQRYSRACGRPHTPETRADWARTWDGRPTALSTRDGVAAATDDPDPRGEPFTCPIAGCGFFTRFGSRPTIVLHLRISHSGSPTITEERR